jgi:hypothetical protein
MPVSKSKQKQVLVSKKKMMGHQGVRRNTRYGTAKRTHRKSSFSRNVRNDCAHPLKETEGGEGSTPLIVRLHPERCM